MQIVSLGDNSQIRKISAAFAQWAKSIVKIAQAKTYSFPDECVSYLPIKTYVVYTQWNDI